MLRAIFLFLLLADCVFGFSGSAMGELQLADTTATAHELSGKVGLADQYVRITLRYRGAYRVTARELQFAGVDLKRIDPRKLGLWNEGVQVPILINTENAAIFSPSDSIE